MNPNEASVSILLKSAIQLLLDAMSGQMTMAHAPELADQRATASIGQARKYLDNALNLINHKDYRP